MAKISPDLLRQRAQKARQQCGLRRWAEEPGVDRWSGSFPSEQAAMGWAAVDALARRYVKDGVCERLEQARGKALLDLVTGNATIDVTVVITTSEGAAPDAPDSTDAGAPEAGPDTPDTPDSPDSPDSPGATDCPPPEADTDDPKVLEPDGSDASEAQHTENGPAGEDDPESENSGYVHEGDLPSPFGGGPAPPAPASASVQPRLTAPLDDDLMEAYGPFAGDPMLVRRAWLLGLLHGGARVRFARCHARTGALLGGADTTTGAYRPGKKLTAVVRTRDGRCRFPGCSVAARFCDLDHVRAWPGGPSAATNLMCLCRRHHRIKQRPGWAVRLTDDGTATWTDPVGRERMTWPRNHLDLLLLPAPTPATAATTATPPFGMPADRAAEPSSTLETVLEVLSDGYPPWTHPDRLPARRPRHGDLIRRRPERPPLRYHRDQHHPHQSTACWRRAVPTPIEIETPPF